MMYRWKEILLRNLSLRILAILLAISTWSWVQVNEEASLLQKVSINYVLPRNLVEGSELPKAVLVELSGSKGLIKSLETINISTTLDLSDGVLGENHIELSTQPILGLPQGVTVTRYTPPSIDIDLDQPMLRELPIRPNIVGSPSKYWRLSKIEISPKTVTIRGPRKLLTSISEIPTQVIDINKIDSPREFKVGLSLPSDVLSVEKNKTISVNIVVEMEVSEKIFSDVSIQLDDPSQQLDTKSVELNVRLPTRDINTLSYPLEININSEILKMYPDRFRYSSETKAYFSIKGFPDGQPEIISITPDQFTVQKRTEE